jgi:hypothetical protein
MSSFICPICSTNRDFVTFSKFFRHITIFHQNEPNFHMTCDLYSSCGISYKTYAAYKSHVYRHHSSDLNLTEENKNNSNYSTTNDAQQLTVGSDPHDTFHLTISDRTDSLNNDDENKNDESIFNWLCYEENNNISIIDIQKSFMLFVLQLREEFHLPKTYVNSVTTYIVTLMNLVYSLFEQNIVANNSDEIKKNLSSRITSESAKMYIELPIIKSLINEVCDVIQDVTKSEYTFLKYCNQYLNYHPPEEIILSNNNEAVQYGHFIPIDRTLMSILRNGNIFFEIMNNINKQHDLIEQDDDLLFSFRHAKNGSRIDDSSLLIQLYGDEIGLMNPLGGKRHLHKMFMLYFSIEDVPDQYRSHLDHIHLVGLCEAEVLKVKLLYFIHCKPRFLAEISLILLR